MTSVTLDPDAPTPAGMRSFRPPLAKRGMPICDIERLSPSTTPPRLNPLIKGITPRLSALRKPTPHWRTARAVITNSPLDSQARMLSEVPLPAPRTDPPLAKPSERGVDDPPDDEACARSFAAAAAARCRAAMI